MSAITTVCPDLQQQVNQLLSLIHQESSLQTIDITQAQTSLGKAISPTFQIVFAGAFSAGKSMLINALLERELLYSSVGHATGTICQIAYAEPNEERVVLTFLSKEEILNYVAVLARDISLPAIPRIDEEVERQQVIQQCVSIITTEGGKEKSKKATNAESLRLLVSGYQENHSRIHVIANNVFSMEEMGWTSMNEAVDFVRRGSGSSILKEIKYYINHPLLQDGNVLIDSPGIDARVERDSEQTFTKVQDPNVSAVISVFKVSNEDFSLEESKLLEIIRSNLGIRERVFYVFNRIDETWYFDQLRNKINQTISEQFQGERVYKTSALLGFFGSQVRRLDQNSRFGLDTIFRKYLQENETPQFVNAFVSYCLTSQKVDVTKFRLPREVVDLPQNIEKYTCILKALHPYIVDQLIIDSGIGEFREAITRYLTDEKRPALVSDLADDLQALCIGLRKNYIEQWQYLEAQPNDVIAMQEQDLRKLNHELKKAGDDFCEHIQKELNLAVGSDQNKSYENDFSKLKQQMVKRLDELLKNFSVKEVYRQAQASHKRNSTVPILGVLAEAFYYLANGLEDTLVEESRETVNNFFVRLLERVRQQTYYRELFLMLGHDGGIEKNLVQAQQQAVHAIVNAAKIECDRYVRERPEFYTEDTFHIWQLRSKFQQACLQFDSQSIPEAEPTIRELLKLDFERKVKNTVLKTFRNSVDTTLTSHLLPISESQPELILQQYDHARQFLGKTLAKEAEETLKKNQLKKTELEQKIEFYNAAVNGINQCLELMGLDRKKLPLILKSDLTLNPVTVNPSAPVSLELPQVYVDAEVIES